MAKDTTHIAVLQRTQKQVQILSGIQGPHMYEIVAQLVDQAWEKARQDGLVTDAMLQVQPTKKKTESQPAMMAAVA